MLQKLLTDFDKLFGVMHGQTQRPTNIVFLNLINFVGIGIVVRVKVANNSTPFKECCSLFNSHET